MRSPIILKNKKMLLTNIEGSISRVMKGWPIRVGTAGLATVQTHENCISIQFKGVSKVIKSRYNPRAKNCITKLRGLINAKAIDL